MPFARAHTVWPGVGCAVGGSRRGSCSASAEGSRQLGDERLGRWCQLKSGGMCKFMPLAAWKMLVHAQLLPGDSRPV